MTKKKRGGKKKERQASERSPSAKEKAPPSHAASRSTGTIEGKRKEKRNAGVNPGASTSGKKG